MGGRGLTLDGYDSFGHPLLRAEHRLREEDLRGLVATASLQKGPRRVSPDFAPSDK